MNLAIALSGWMAAPSRSKGRETEQNLDERREAQFDGFVRSYQRDVFRIALSVLGPGSEEDAEDVTQEVLLRTFTSLGDFRGDSKIESWLYRATFNAAVSSRRRLRYRTPHVEVTHAELESSRGTRGSAGRVDDHDTRQLVEKLPHLERSTVYLYYWLGYRSGEIAVFMNCSEATVRSRLLRARKRLRDMFNARPAGRGGRQP